MVKVMNGEKPGRPYGGFSDALWSLLLAVWDAEYGSKASSRPPIQMILDRLKEDSIKWHLIIVLTNPEQGGGSRASSADSKILGGSLRHFPL